MSRTVFRSRVIDPLLFADTDLGEMTLQTDRRLQLHSGLPVTVELLSFSLKRVPSRYPYYYYCYRYYC